MNLFESIKPLNINQAAEECAESEDILLLDVRGTDEYAQGHIPGSVNLPLQLIDNIESLAENKAQKIFVYCLSGMRSRSAQKRLNKLGYSNVVNIGGFSNYSGLIEK